MKSADCYQWFGDITGLAMWGAKCDMAHRRKTFKSRLKAGERQELPMALVGTDAGTMLEVATPLGIRHAAIGDWIVYDGSGGFHVHADGESS